MHSTPANKALASRVYSNKSFSNPDSDNSRGKSSSTCNTAFKWNTIEVYISGALVIYTKV